MEEMTHTPEPWYQSHRPIPNDKNGMYSTQVYTADGETIATLHWYPKPQKKGVHEGKPVFITGTYRAENAARIVACVNHCKGATNEELELASHEQLVQRFENEARDLGIAENEITQLKAQRDELMQALNKIVHAVKFRIPLSSSIIFELIEAEKVLKKATGEL